eukprot:387671-Prymnesium_polylepis.1
MHTRGRGGILGHAYPSRTTSQRHIPVLILRREHCRCGRLLLIAAGRDAMAAPIPESDASEQQREQRDSNSCDNGPLRAGQCADWRLQQHGAWECVAWCCAPQPRELIADRLEAEGLIGTQLRHAEERLVAARIWEAVRAPPRLHAGAGWHAGGAESASVVSLPRLVQPLEDDPAEGDATGAAVADQRRPLIGRVARLHRLEWLAHTVVERVDAPLGHEHRLVARGGKQLVEVCRPRLPLRPVAVEAPYVHERASRRERRHVEVAARHWH